MKPLVLGVIVLAAALAAIVPSGLNWAPDVLRFLKGSIPVLAIFAGLVLLFIGIADIKDLRDSKKEEKENSTD
ncbi:MAG: hypothetical protein LBI85_02685 [Spirochaetaceae bacterium]|jgi:small neutral amino acid transporter SnatA (MarC family)|nr:hypothetical protein [Spirochaetaceae bacterium]